MHVIPHAARPLPLVPCLPRGGGGGGGTLAGWFCVGVCCVSLLSRAASLVNIRPKGPCVEVQYPCSIVVAFPVPSHHLGLALAGTLVPLLALPYRKWSEFFSGVGVSGKHAAPPKWGHGIF